jgi:hypothetical protein
MIPWRTLLLGALVLLAQACASVTVEREFDPDARFETYRTFDWMPREGRRVDLRVRAPEVDGEIRAAIERELGAKGVRRMATEEPDIRVGYLLVLDQSLDSQTIYEGADPNWRYRTYGPGTVTTHMGTLIFGTLVIDVFDAERRESVWRGVAEGQVRENQDAAKRRARIDKAVKSILAEFPPKR